MNRKQLTLNDLLCNLIPYLAKSVFRFSDPCSCHSHSFSPTTLLHHMRQLMCQQPLPFCSGRRILSNPENNIPPQRKRPGTNRLSSLCCLSISMNADLAKIMAEARLHKGANRLGEKLPASPD